MPVDLSHLEDDFAAAAEEKARNFDPLPDGKYVVRVAEALVTESKSGTAMLKWQLQVVGGRFNGRFMWRQNMLESKQNCGWLKRDLAVCDITLAKVNDLNERARELVGLHLEVTQKTAGQYSNVYLNRLLSPIEVAALYAERVPVDNVGGDEPPARAGTVDDDDIPF